MVRKAWTVEDDLPNILWQRILKKNRPPFVKCPRQQASLGNVQSAVPQRSGKGSVGFAAPQQEEKPAERSVPPTVRRFPPDVSPASHAQVARLQATVDVMGGADGPEVRSLGGFEEG